MVWDKTNSNMGMCMYSKYNGVQCIGTYWPRFLSHLVRVLRAMKISQCRGPAHQEDMTVVIQWRSEVHAGITELARLVKTEEERWTTRDVGKLSAWCFYMVSVNFEDVISYRTPVGRWQRFPGFPMYWAIWDTHAIPTYGLYWLCDI